MENNEKILRLKEVIAIVGLGRSSIYQQIKRGAFPTQIKLSTKSSGWLKSEIENWIEMRAALRFDVSEGDGYESHQIR